MFSSCNQLRQSLCLVVQSLQSLCLREKLFVCLREPLKSQGLGAEWGLYTIGSDGVWNSLPAGAFQYITIQDPDSLFIFRFYVVCSFFIYYFTLYLKTQLLSLIFSMTVYANFLFFFKPIHILKHTKTCLEVFGFLFLLLLLFSSNLNFSLLHTSSLFCLHE